MYFYHNDMLLYHDDKFRGYNCISAQTYNWYKFISIITICFYTTKISSYHDDKFRGYNCIKICLSFCMFSFGHYVVCFFELRVRIRPFVSSNSSWYQCISIITICFYTPTIGFSTTMTSFADITVLVQIHTIDINLVLSI